MADWRSLALLSAPALLSCSLLLDFDSLQAGTGGVGGAAAGVGGIAMAGTPSNGGTEAGSTGESAAAGSSGAGTCPAECFHDDPCLQSGCRADGECKKGRATGLVLDGIDETVPADTHYRVTMASGDDAFFLSSYASTGGKSEVTFYRLSATQDAFAAVASLGGLNISKMGDPVSAAGLTVQPGVGLIHAFVALDARAGTGSRVWHLVMDMSFNAQAPTPVGSIADGYWADSPYNYPASIYASGQVYTAWINADQTISLSDGTATPAQLLSAGTAAMTLSLFSSTDDQPQVLYGVSGGGVFIERPGLAPYALAECQSAPGQYLSSSATFSGLTGTGLWLGSWTKFASATDTDPGYLTTNGRAMGCSKDACTSDTDPCAPDAANNLARNPATVIVHRPGDPTGLVEFVQASPLLTTAGSQAQASLILLQETIDFGTTPLASPPVTKNIAAPILLASQATTSPYRGPDFPAVGFVPPDRFAVAWTQPAASSGDELRVQRYRMCLPAE